MRILSLHIEGFGKLHKKDLTFSGGLNGIYGENESGKSTLMAFIRAMLYGLNGKSTSVSQNTRKKYMPWDGSAFGGSLFLEEKGEQFEITRTFGSTKKGDTVRILNRATGEIVPLSPGQEPGDLLFRIPEAVFAGTLHVTSGGAALPDGETLSDRMQNMAGTGQEDVALKQVLARLHKAKLSLDSSRGQGGELNRLQGQLHEARKLALEGDRREERLREIEKELKALEEEKEAAKNPVQQETLRQLRQARAEMDVEELPHSGLVFLLLFILVLLVAVGLGLFYNLLGFGLILPACLLLSLYLVRQSRRKAETRALEEEKIELDGEIAKLETLLHDISVTDDIDQRILNKRIERGTLLNIGSGEDTKNSLSALESREKEIRQKLSALTLAETTLTELGSLREKSLTPFLSARMKELLPLLTDGHYRESAIDGKLNVSLQSDSGALHASDFLSSGATEQTYLALRLSLIDILGKSLGSTLPVTLDDPFVLYDAARKAAAQKVLADYASQGWQILLFTCRREDLPSGCRKIEL